MLVDMNSSFSGCVRVHSHMYLCIKHHLAHVTSRTKISNLLKFSYTHIACITFFSEMTLWECIMHLDLGEREIFSNYNRLKMLHE